MAEAGHPLCELCPLGGAVSVEPSLSAQPHPSPSSESATEGSTTSRGADATQPNPKETLNDTCKDHPMSCMNRDTDCSSVKADGQPFVSEICEPSRALGRPVSLVETSHHQDKMATSANESQTVQCIKPACLPVTRSHSDTLPLVKQEGAPQAPDICRLSCHGRDKTIQEANGSKLVGKQPMQLQRCNLVTTMSQGASSVDSRFLQQLQGHCVCSSTVPATSAKVEQDPKEQTHPLAPCDKALCYSYINHANFEDTFAAYCHPQPIPAPSQLMPRLTASEATAAPPPAATNHLTLPRLISSVSETGLDAKHVLRCCNLNCSWINSLPQPQRHFGEECCSSITSTTRDMGTMTTHKELRDVGVQTGESATPHVFPQVCLADENQGETSCSQTAKSSTDGSKKSGGATKSPVKEVKWDAEGMTWEVYGASVDPEELGLAIQKHLELQIKETASRAAKLSRQNTNTSRQSADTGCRRKRSRMMSSIRPPVCCARTTTAVD
ncbi:uncharacterized protein LOC115434154 [Sphaeramia orbicularis]|uniref:uncharacterized protein LOC115434154 n=1 Tax=Sphaeramia orbicularis TaxID=375764 RepID=UPI0011812C61|nr:uncharacterized protein LOC115434154 [Sphaeramia orbicularis]